MDMTLREVCTATNVTRRAVQGYEKAGLKVQVVKLQEQGENIEVLIRRAHELIEKL